MPHPRFSTTPAEPPGHECSASVAPRQEWLLRRNCVLSPRRLALAFALPCGISLAIALSLTLAGAWWVLVFSCIEVSAVVWAFLYYARHATDRERIVLEGGRLLVETVEAQQRHEVWLDACWTKVALPSGPRGLIELEAKGVKVGVGRFVPGEMRRTVARELRSQLQGGLTA